MRRATRIHPSALASVPAIALLAMLAGCQAIPTSAPPPSAPTPAPAPAPATPPPSPPEPDLSWEEAPVAPGTWTYAEQGGVKTAAFGRDTVLIGCRPATRQIELSVAAANPAARTMTIRTSFGILQWAGAVIAPATGGAARLQVTRSATDSGFDQIAYSRGRVAIEVAGTSRLIIPAWAEIGRVIEDCRN